MRQPVLAVFTATIPNEVCVAGVYPPLRNDDIENSASDKVRKEKFCAWKLLEYALLQVFGKAMREISFTRLPNGKWTCDFCYFSLTFNFCNLLIVCKCTCSNHFYFCRNFYCLFLAIILIMFDAKLHFFIELIKHLQGLFNINTYICITRNYN